MEIDNGALFNLNVYVAQHEYNTTHTSYLLTQKSTPPARHLPANIDCRELKRAVSFLMDHLYLMTTPCLFQTVIELQHCVACANDELPFSVSKNITDRVKTT